MKKTILLLLATLSLSNMYAQIGIGTETPSPSAMLEVQSTNKGFLPPRLTNAERDAILNPAEGLTIYNIEGKCLEFFEGDGWKNYCQNVVLLEGEVVSPKTNKIWLNKNLGALQVASTRTDEDAYGDLYQWGRAKDNHQLRSSIIYDGENNTLATTTTPNLGNAWDGKFIVPEVMGPRDWLVTHEDNLWQGVNGVNNPCPTGYRVPTEVEWTIELLNWETYDSVGAFDSVLKIPEAGYRDFQGNILFGYEDSLFWTSTINGFRSRGLIIGDWGYEFFNGSRAEGFSVRCIKD